MCARLRKGSSVSACYHMLIQHLSRKQQKLTQSLEPDGLKLHVSAQDEEAWPSTELFQNGNGANSSAHTIGQASCHGSPSTAIPLQAQQTAQWTLIRTLRGSPTKRRISCAGGREEEHFAFEHKQRSQQRWMDIGHERMLSLEEGMLVEYDVPSRAPIGAVFLSIGSLPASQASHPSIKASVAGTRG